ncbi:Uncharacterised protein [Mycobacterium tuberculosis]|nr:Uncharacterised protein [Mycobacterium tuberculosis]
MLHGRFDYYFDEIKVRDGYFVHDFINPKNLCFAVIVDVPLVTAFLYFMQTLITPIC